MVKEVKKLTPAEVIASEDALMDFQFAVIDALNAKGITQVEFAEMLGVSRARVSQMLSSDANPTLRLVGRALHALGLKTCYLSSDAAATEEVLLDNESYDGEINEEDFLDWELCEVEFEEADFAGASMSVADSSGRWWAVQHHEAAPKWGSPRAVANLNVHKKLAAA